MNLAKIDLWWRLLAVLTLLAVLLTTGALTSATPDHASRSDGWPRCCF